MAIKTYPNKKAVANRSRFNGTTNMKTKAAALAWIASSIDAAKSVSALKAQVEAFEVDIVNVVFDSMGIEE